MTQPKKLIGIGVGIAVIVVIILAVLFSMGGGNSQKAIIGKWKWLQGSKFMSTESKFMGADIIEFFKDGTVSFQGKESMNGNYEFFPEDKILRVTTSYGSGILDITFIAKNQLIMKDSLGRIYKYKRVK